MQKKIINVEYYGALKIIKRFYKDNETLIIKYGRDNHTNWLVS